VTVGQQTNRDETINSLVEVIITYTGCSTKLHILPTDKHAVVLMAIFQVNLG